MFADLNSKVALLRADNREHERQLNENGKEIYLHQKDLSEQTAQNRRVVEREAELASANLEQKM